MPLWNYLPQLSLNLFGIPNNRSRRQPRPEGIVKDVGSTGRRDVAVHRSEGSSDTSPQIASEVRTPSPSRERLDKSLQTRSRGGVTSVQKRGEAGGPASV
jgi:hypothetical protein